MTKITEDEKFKISLAFFIGCGLFTTQIAWSLYNTQVNQMLFVYLGSFVLIGLVMALDNIIGIIIQPIMGHVSDNTRTKLGRRIPYLIIGIPVSAIFFALIGSINPHSDPFWLLILWLVFFVTTMAFYCKYYGRSWNWNRFHSARTFRLCSISILYSFNHDDNNFNYHVINCQRKECF